MTAPFYDRNDIITVNGRSLPLTRWQNAAREAQAALRANERDEEAREALDDAQEALRAYAGELGNRAQGLNQQDQFDAQNVSGGLSFGQGFSQGATFGFGDEIAGLAGMLPGGQGYRAARDEARQTTEDARGAHPWLTLLGDAAGSIGSGIGGAGLLPAKAARFVASGGRLGAGLGVGQALAGGAIGAGEGAVRGLGSGEGDVGDQLSSAGSGAVVGGILGTLGTGTVNAARRFGAGRAAKQMKLADEARAASTNADASELRLQALRDAMGPRQAILDEQAARAPIMTSEAQRRAAFAVENEPLQQTIMDSRAAQAGLREAQAEELRSALRTASQEGQRPVLPDPNPPDPIRRVQATVETTRPPEVQVGEPQLPGQALHDVAGNPIPGTEVTPVNSLVSRATRSADTPLPFTRGLDNVVMATDDQVAAARAARLPDLPDGTTFEQTVARFKAEKDALIAARDAKYDFINGEWVPKSTMPHDPREAARAAFNLTEAAGVPDPTAAARRSAGMAGDAVPRVDVRQSLVDDLNEQIARHAKNPEDLIDAVGDWSDRLGSVSKGLPPSTQRALERFEEADDLLLEARTLGDDITRTRAWRTWKQRLGDLATEMASPTESAVPSVMGPDLLEIQQRLGPAFAPIQQVLRQAPSEEGIRVLQGLVTPENQSFVMTLLPQAWKEFLGL